MKPYCSKYLLLLSFFFAAIASHAQNIDEDEGILSPGGYNRLLGVGVGATYRSFLDQGLSNLTYRKPGATVYLENLKTDDMKFTDLSIQASYLTMQRKTNDLTPGEAKSFKGVIDYRHTYKINVLNENVYDVRLGAVLSGLVDIRNMPQLNYSAQSYEHAFSLGFHGKIARSKNMNSRNGSIIWDLSIPFVSEIGRPPYNNTNGEYDPSYKPLKGFFGKDEIATFRKFFRITSRVHWQYPLKNGNKIRFSYTWDYYKMKGATTVYSAEHTLTAAFLLNY